MIGNGLLGLVDTIAGGLSAIPMWWMRGPMLRAGWPKAALVGDLSSVLPEVIADLRANSVVDAAIDATVTDAIETLFGDTGLWDALQTAVVDLAGEIFGDAPVQQAIARQVKSLVSGLLGGGVLRQHRRYSKWLPRSWV